MSNSGQEFVARDGAPWVQIEYDVELYGRGKKVQLTVVMGVRAGLPEDQSSRSLWSLHPAVIERLRRSDEMIVFEAPELY